MRPCDDDVMTQLERLRVEVADLRRCQKDLTRRYAGHRLRIAAGFFAGAIGVAAMSTFVPTLGAQEFTIVRAPFHVVDERGDVIMRVTSGGVHSRGLQVYSDPSLTSRVSIGVHKGAVLGMHGFNASGRLVADIGHNAGGAGLVSVSDAAGKQRAYLSGRSGTIAVRNSKEIVVAGLSVQDDMGVVQVENGQPLAVLTQTDQGNGLFHLYNAAGEAMVEAGTNARSAGFVGAGPGSRAMLPGIPGSYIIGKR